MTTYTIGPAARLCAISVRTLRYYSDVGLLPPARRSDGGYRIYTDAHLLRLNLIRALRDAGLGLDAIRRVLSREISIGEALRMHLAALEAEIAAKKRVAAVIRASLRGTEPTEEDIRRLLAMTKISRAERRAVIERFYEQISAGLAVDPEWKRKLIEASTPELPDEPTPAQIDAWIELSGIVADPSFVDLMRTKTAIEWQEGVDHAAQAAVLRDVLARAGKAIEAGYAPDSSEGAAIAREWVAASARAVGREPDEIFKAYLRSTFANRDPRKGRYWKLVAILRGEAPEASPNREWKWAIEAMRHYLGS